jgi:putative endonuclease
LDKPAVKTSYVYITASTTRKTYIGVTSDLERRIWEHRARILPGHTHTYNKVLLVYIEEFENIDDAIAREK